MSNGVKHPVENLMEWVHLGVFFKARKKFGCSIYERIKKFYKCSLECNLSYWRLTYAIEVIDVLDEDEYRQLRVAYNSLFRKIFHYGRFESVKKLQHFLKRPTWEV